MPPASMPCHQTEPCTSCDDVSTVSKRMDDDTRRMDDDTRKTDEVTGKIDDVSKKINDVLKKIDDVLTQNAYVKTNNHVFISNMDDAGRRMSNNSIQYINHLHGGGTIDTQGDHW